MQQTQEKPFIAQVAILIAGILVLGGGVLWFTRSRPVALPAGNANIPASALTVQTKAFAEETPTVTVDVQYPFVEGIADVEQAEMLNGELSHVAFATLDAFEREVAETASPDPLGSKSSIAIRAAVGLLTPEIVSVRYDISVYSAGAAHPNAFYKTLTWDVPRATEIPLTSLFRPGVAYLERLSTLAIADLERQFATDEENFEALSTDIRAGASPRAEHFAAWTMDGDGLMLWFEPYQVAPYAAGPQQVRIPWSSLRDILSSDALGYPLLQ